MSNSPSSAPSNSIQYAPSVERWRSLVASIVPSQYVDKVLWTINYESGGDPNAVGDNGHSIGLLQIQNDLAFSGRPTTEQLLDPAYNIRYAAEQLGINNGNFGAWGEGTSYNGAVFGALGNHPYPYDITGASTRDPQNPPINVGGGTAIPAGYVNVGIPFVPNPGDIIDTLGNAIDIIPGGSYVTDAAGNVYDMGGKLVGRLNDKAKGLIPGLGGLESLAGSLKSIADLFGQVPTLLTNVIKAFVWLLDPRHWFRLFFIAAGATLVIVGGYMYVRGDKAVADAETIGKVAAA